MGPPQDSDRNTINGRIEPNTSSTIPEVLLYELGNTYQVRYQYILVVRRTRHMMHLYTTVPTTTPIADNVPTSSKAGTLRA